VAALKRVSLGPQPRLRQRAHTIRSAAEPTLQMTRLRDLVVFAHTAFVSVAGVAAGPVSSFVRPQEGARVAEGLRLDLTPPAHGWATVRLTAPDAGLEFVASYTPRDSIGDLASAAIGLVAGIPEQVVTWNTEPAEYEFRLITTGGRGRLEVREFSDHQRQRSCTPVPTIVVEDDAVAIARVLWRGLRRLQGMIAAEEFAAGWGHPFPAAAVERLGERLRASAAH
jgi:hypothetical protein